MKNATFERNTEGRDYFVGDLHGMYNAFMYELQDIRFDIDVDRMFSVGDLADRGPDSVKCLNLLREPWFHATRGNHEDFLLGSHTQYVWEHNGGMWSDNIDHWELNDLRNLVREKMHRTMTIDTHLGKIGVVHAESHDDWTWNSPLTDNMNTWARTRIKCGQNTPIKNIDRVVVGHSVVKEVVRLGNILYIDTGAVYEREFTVVDVDQVFNGKYKII